LSKIVLLKNISKLFLILKLKKKRTRIARLKFTKFHKNIILHTHYLYICKQTKLVEAF